MHPEISSHERVSLQGFRLQALARITPQEMVEMALKEPESAKANWDVAYISSMSAQ